MLIFKKWKLKKLMKRAEVFYKKRLNENVSDSEIKKEIQVHRQIIAFYEKNKFDNHFPNAESYIQEGLRLIALLNDLDAQYELSKKFIEKGKFWESLKKSVYSAPIQEEYAKSIYKEAFAFLKAAEDGGNALAIRLHGLALINGWGTAKDEDQGFKLIVKSIDKENAWDKATKIFEELGLNKPEFFSSMIALKNKAKE